MVGPSAVKARLAEATSRASAYFSSRRNGWLLTWLPPLLLWGFFVWTGVMGVDFGRHWDEWYQVVGVGDCLDRMTFAAQRYVYNGLYFSLGLVVLLAHLRSQIAAVVVAVVKAPPSTTMDLATVPAVKQFQTDGHTFLSSADYLLQTRTVFLLVSSAAIFFVYLVCRRLFPSRRLAAVAGAAFLALSWEFQYHARWVAIDSPMTCFITLELALFCCGMISPRRSILAAYLVAAGLAGGCALGCKATAIFAVIPVLMGPWMVARLPLQTRALLTVCCVASFFAAAFITSPAMFLDPLHMIATLRYARSDYNVTGSQHPNVVSGPVEHVLRLLLWLTAAVPSPSVWRAVPLSMVAAIGLLSIGRRHPRIALPWVTFVVVMTAFMASNHLMIVRQYLSLIPLMAIGFGVGVACLFDWVTRPLQRRVLAFAVALVMALNARWLHAAARSIAVMTPADIQATLLKDLVREKTAVSVSPVAFALMKPSFDADFRCEPAAGRDPKARPLKAVFQYLEHPAWKCNRLGTLGYTYGPHDANYDWYSAFPGKYEGQRLLKVPRAFADFIKLDTSAYTDCMPK